MKESPRSARKKQLEISTINHQNEEGKNRQMGRIVCELVARNDLIIPIKGKEPTFIRAIFIINILMSMLNVPKNNKE